MRDRLAQSSVRSLQSSGACTSWLIILLIDNHNKRLIKEKGCHRMDGQRQVHLKLMRVCVCVCVCVCMCVYVCVCVTTGNAIDFTGLGLHWLQYEFDNYVCLRKS